jgi:hypothetical protein
MARIARDVCLKHRANLGEDVRRVTCSAGDEVTILKEWATHYLIKDSDGRVFNVVKDLVEDAG